MKDTAPAASNEVCKRYETYAAPPVRRQSPMKDAHEIARVLPEAHPAEGPP